MHRAFALSVACTAVLLASAPAHAGGGFLPPLEIELGGVVLGDHGGGETAATQLLVGISWASLYPKPTPVDVSLGVITTYTPAPTSPTVARTTMEPARPSADAVGGFLDLALKIDSRPHLRTWLGGRGELMGNDGVGVLGAAMRMSVELWAPAVLTGNGGGIMGTVALSAWAELGVRERSDRSVSSFAGAGLGVRLPMVLASH